MPIFAMNPNNTSENAPGGTVRAGMFATHRFKHQCANRDCHRGKLWSRWLTRTESVQFAGENYCCAACAEDALELAIGNYLSHCRPEAGRPFRIPLGLVLISRGSLTNPQLQAALNLQREQPAKRLGALLSEMGLLTEEDLVAALGVQWSCPVYPLEKGRAQLDCVGLLPFAVSQSCGVLPVHHSPATGMLHLAFTKRIDHTLLYSIEQMLGYRIAPCVASERAVAEVLHLMRRPLIAQETVFDSIRQSREMARIAVNYASKLHAAKVLATVVADYIWLRLENSFGMHHLLFQTRAEVFEQYP
jgi:hypothetical protein